jgi:hypothetical protein
VKVYVFPVNALDEALARSPATTAAARLMARKLIPLAAS